MHYWHDHAFEGTLEGYVRFVRRVRISIRVPRQQLTQPFCSKIQKFVLGKKSTVGDRPASRKRDNPIGWERMPFVAKPILTREDVDEQKQTVSMELLTS